MKQHEFKIVHDTATDVWYAYVKVPFLFFWSVWKHVPKADHGIWHELKFYSEQDCLKGIEKWKREHSPDYIRYQTTHLTK